ncbi:MAG: type II secretion system protein [Pseudomonadota bacterium]|nr:type II secretion system protein [Pseudomonadota bacterium]
MSRFTRRNAAGFSLLELMVVVAILGVLATFAIPRFNIFRARARQGEAKSNLGVIFTLQEAFKIDKEEYYNGDDSYWGGAAMDGSTMDTDSVGYSKKTEVAGNCLANKLGFRLANCSAARYRYWVAHAGEDYFSAAAAAHSDVQEKRIFPGCAGAGAANTKASTSDSGKKKCLVGTCTTTAGPPAVTTCTGEITVASGDAFCLDHERTVDNFRDIVSAADCTD